MYTHHQDTIQRTIEYFKAQPEVRALLLGGSIAHGFAEATSDVDVMIIVSDEDHQRRFANDALQFFSTELSTYPKGYVDGKYISERFLSQVAQSGSEPARFAFADAQILYSNIDQLDACLAQIARYPVEDKLNRIKRFNAQFEGWRWYVGEADKRQNPYLLMTAVHKLLLFGGRMVLAHNELLYPFHKWFFAMLDRAQDKPANLVATMQALSHAPTYADAVAFFELIKGYREWEQDEFSWPNRFMKDSELTWMDGTTAIDDI